MVETEVCGCFGGDLVGTREEIRLRENKVSFI